MSPARGDAVARLTSGPVTPALLAFALPGLASSILQSLNGSINAIWIGRFLGEEAIAATSNANLLMFLMFTLSLGFGMAASVYIGQHMGRREVDAARRVMGTTLGLFGSFALLCAIAGWQLAPHLLGWLGTPPEASTMALAYLRVILISLPASFVFSLLVMGLRGTGDSMTPLAFMGVSVLIDAVLNPALILGLGPFPRLGIAGSGMATVIAGYVSLTGLIVTIYVRDLPLRLRGRELRYLWPEAALLREIAGRGVLMGLQMLVMAASGIVMIGLVNREGVIAAAAYGVAQQVWTYIQMPAIAISSAMSAMVAQNIGAGRWDRVGAITRAGLLSSLAITLAGIALILLFDRPVIALFIGGDADAMPLGAHILLIASWSFLFFAAASSLFAAMRANGAVVGPLVATAASLFGFRILAAHALLPRLGMDALWWSFPLSSLLLLLFAMALHRWSGWRGRPLAAHPIDPVEAEEEAFAAAEPGGRISPTA